MSIVTISRGTFSGGKELAECLASRLGYECVSREVMLEAAQKYGVSADAIAAAIEKAPRFLDRLGRQRDAYVAFFRATLCEWALRGKLVYHGNAGHFLLAGVGHVLRARVVAPMEYRIAAAMKRLSASRSEAIAYIDRVDRERTRWTQFLYHVSWEDPHHYDIVLNLESMSMDTACEVLAHMAQRPDFQPTPESEAAMHNLAVKSRVLAAFAADPATSDAAVDVLVDHGSVTLNGWVKSQQSIDSLVEVARRVEGVREVTSQLAFKSGVPF